MIVFLVLLAVIAPIVVVKPLDDQVVLPKLATTAAFTGGALVWGAVLLARGRRPAVRWPATLWALVVAFVAANVLAAVFAVDRRFSLMGEHLRYQGLATTLLYALLFAVAAVAVRGTRELRWLLWALFAGALGIAIYALIQKAGLDWVEWTGQALDRPAATLGQANVFGAFQVAAISATAFLALTARERWQQAALGAALVAMLFALFFSVSRSAYIGLFVALVVWSAAAVLWFAFLRHGRRPSASQWAAMGLVGGGAALLAVALAVAAVSVVLAPFPQGRGGLTEAAERLRASDEITSESVGGRLSLWRLALEMTADRPLLGHGQDAFAIRFAEYRDRPDLPGIRTDNVAPESAHNLYLDLASGTGVLGLLAFLALVGAVLWHAARRALATDDDGLRVALVALGAGVVGYLTALFFGFSEAMTSWVLWLLLGATAGLLASPAPAGEGGAGRAPASARLAQGLVAAGALVVGVAALGWAATLTAADLAAGQAQEAAKRGDYDGAVRLAGRAVTLNPLQETYLLRKAEAYEFSAGRAADEVAALRQAIATYETARRRFKPDAFTVLSLATASLQLAQAEGKPVEDTFGLFEEALRLDRYNVLYRRFVADRYEELGYDEAALLHRTFIYCWNVGCD